MFQVACAACSSTFEYNTDDYIHLCPVCSTGFVIDFEEGAKDIVGDHFIIPNRLDREQVIQTFYEWIKHRHHRADEIQKRFKVLGVGGVCYPFWVVSSEAHTFWSGYSSKANQYSGAAKDFGSRFVREEGRFSKRYRWCICARNSTKEYWGLERLHTPKETVSVDWDGFPLDETVGVAKDMKSSIYELKQTFKFESSNGLTVSGIQLKEHTAIAKTKDHIGEFHRRISKTKVGTLTEYRTEIEIVGIHLIHMPIWILRYSYAPGGFLRFFTAPREKKMIVHGFTHKVMEAQLPMEREERVMVNVFLTGLMALISLAFAVFVNAGFFVLFCLFAGVCGWSAWKSFSKSDVDPETEATKENPEPAEAVVA